MEGPYGSADERLAQVRGRTLDLLLLVTFLAALVPVVLFAPLFWLRRDYLFLVVSTGGLLVDAVLIAGRKVLPYALRAWGLCLVPLVILAAHVPRGVFAIPLAQAAWSALYAALLLGSRAGAGYTIALAAILLVGGLLPPDLRQALAFGPAHSGSEPPVLVAAGLIPLLAGIAGIGIVVRGLLSGFQDSQASEQRFRDIMEMNPDSIMLISWPDGRIRDVNPGFTRFLGWTREEVVGKTGAEVGMIRETDLQLLHGRFVLQEDIEGLEMMTRRRDGALVPMQVNFRRAEIGGAPTVLAVGHEVTTQRRLEVALRHAQRVEAMGTLAGGIAHNFRNALGSILPNLDFCLQAAAPELREPLEDARSAASAAVDLASRLTRMTRQDAGARLEPVELRAVLADVLGISRSTFGARVAIRESLGDGDGGGGLVLADRGDLHQVFLNLLLNARDAVEEVASPRIEVSLARSPDGASLVVTVADDGQGMDAETLRHVGEPFFTTKPEGRGTGLGLSTAFDAVREMGGRITASSSPGAGTTLTVELPVYGGPAAQAHQSAVRPLHGEVRVLVVDDDPLLLEALSRQLAALGLHAEPFTDPTAALARLLASPGAFDALITDLDMPVLSGAALAARALQAAPGLSVIVLSATPEAEPIAGAVAVLAKPATAAELAGAMARCLGIDAAQAAPGAVPAPA